MTLHYAIRGIAAAERARHFMRRTGLSPWGIPLWTEKEDKILKQLHPDYTAIKRKLKRRTRIAIRMRAAKWGLTKKIHYWTAADISKLRRIYPVCTKAEVMATFPHVTWEQISNCRQYHRIYKKRKPFKRTGFEILDEIRRRAFELNLTMPDLDEIARTGEYFQTARWFLKDRPNPKAVMRAIEALGGKIVVQWDD
jgi:hypothetical protein